MVSFTRCLSHSLSISLPYTRYNYPSDSLVLSPPPFQSCFSLMSLPFLTRVVSESLSLVDVVYFSHSWSPSLFLTHCLPQYSLSLSGHSITLSLVLPLSHAMALSHSSLLSAHSMSQSLTRCLSHSLVIPRTRSFSPAVSLLCVSFDLLLTRCRSLLLLSLSHTCFERSLSLP